jgi:hypothetical protein
MKAKSVKEVFIIFSDRVEGIKGDEYIEFREGFTEALASIKELIEKEKKIEPAEYPYGSCDEYRCSDRLDGFNQAIDRILKLFEG